MSESKGKSVRGFRPSRFGLSDEEASETIRIKAANVDAYARRVRAGLPVFAEGNTASSPESTTTS